MEAFPEMVDGGGHRDRAELSQREIVLLSLSQPEVGGAGPHYALSIPQAWLWIITMNGCTGQMPSSQSSAASGSMARTPSWLLTANEVRV